MDRLDEFLHELNRELIETRNQTIKTDNSIRNLSGDIKQISKNQESYERRTIFTNVIAYILFAALTFSGLFLYFKAAISRSELDHELAAAEQENLQQVITGLEAELERRRESEREAYDFYELLVNGSRDEVVERFPTVQGRLLDRATIELFRREVDAIRHDLARESFRFGRSQIEPELWAEARDAFTRSMEYVEEAPYTPELHNNLAVALHELAEYEDAIRYFDLAIATGELSRNEEIYAYFHRAEALERMDRYEEAVDAYRTFTRRYDTHSWVGYANRRIESCNRNLAEE